MPKHVKAKLIKKEKLTEGIYKFSIDAEEIAKTAMPRTIFRNKGTRQNRTIIKKTNKYI